jgi:phosphoserine aminotransferase
MELPMDVDRAPLASTAPENRTSPPAVSERTFGRVFNFAAGPAMLPLEVLEQAREELTDWGGCGMSVMEVSHRSKAFVGLAQELEVLLRELAAIPSHYKVLLMQGGATAQFAGVPLNLATTESTVDYVNTGSWSKKAIAEARRYCKVNIAADRAASGYNTVPDPDGLQLTADAA